MDSILSTAISFAISYVANCLPVPTKDLDGRLEACYHRALDRWNVPQDTKESAKDDMTKHLVGLKEIITHTSRGRHPKECELLQLWAKEILGDSDCNQFILAHQNEILQIEMRKGFLKVEDVIEAINRQKEELDKVSQKIQQLLNRGVQDATTYWEKWATGAKDLKLGYDIVLSGRKEASEEILTACHTPKFVSIESSSLSDAFAFSVATIMKESPEDVSRTLIIENAETYREFLNEKTSLLIITNVQENPNYAVSKGHSVILCGTPADKSSYAGKITLPTVNRDGFRSALEVCGFDSNTISNLIIETKRESALLRRTLGINHEKEAWLKPEYNRYYIPAFLLGSWDETRNGDKQIVESLAGMDYTEFDKGLQILLNSDESPLLKVGSVWQVSSPKLFISRIQREISNDTIDHLKECVDWVLEDDDPDVIAKRDATDMRFWQDKHLYSGHLRTGLLQSTTIMAVVMEAQGISTGWIDTYIASKLKDFTLERFLSNRNNLQWIAESSPSSFLTYLEDDIKAGMPILSKVFEVKHSEYSITGTEIYYSELLSCLEQLAWDIRYLQRVTAILLEFCRFPNDSNYSNRPSASLYSIYRFMLSQTLATFSQRLGILHSLSERYPIEISEICYKLLDGIKQTVFMPTSHFRWRYSDQIKSPTYISPIPATDVNDVTKLLLSIIEMNSENICKLIDLVTNVYMDSSHSMIMSVFTENDEKMKGNEVIVECLRKNINHHIRCKTATWAIKGERLAQLQELLARIESDDVVIRNKHYFAEYLVKDGLEDLNKDFKKQIKESRIFRKNILENIIASKGWDAIWTMPSCVGNTDGLAEAIVELSGDSKLYDVFELYSKKMLDNKFVRKYFRTLFCDFGKEKYLRYINELKAISENNIGIILYSPDVIPEISTIVDTLHGSLQKEYWENVGLWGLTVDNVVYAIERLRGVGRYAEIFSLIYQNEFRAFINSTLWLEVLIECFDNGKLNVLLQESYYISEILKCVQLPNEAVAKGKLLLLELAMYDYLKHYLNNSEFHLIHLVNTEPEMMMELVQLAFLEDEGYREELELTETERRNKLGLKRLACNFFYHYHDVPGTRPDGTIDGLFLKDYLIKLQQIAQMCHRIDVLPVVIGRILGNMPEKEDYPSDLMCELVEYFNDDSIDNEIGCCVSNRRGMSSRSSYSGGDIERSHIDTFKKYRDRALTRSPHLTKVFENEIKSYEHLATIEDERGKLADLNY